MKTSHRIFLGLLLTATSFGTAYGDDPSEPAPHRGPERSVARLGWEILRSISDGNVVVSPLGIWEALAMLQTGARAETADEIATVLGMADDPEKVASASSSVRAAVLAASGEQTTIDVANRLWIREGKLVETSFTRRLEERFGATLGRLDLGSGPDAARAEVNAWVRERTSGRIDELLKPGNVDEQTEILLTNAVYLKADWEVPFPRNATRDDDFRVTAEETVEVPFMNRSGKMMAGTADGATIVVLPYRGSGLAMIVAVPIEVDGATALLARMDGSSLDEWSTQLRHRYVALSLPAFTARRPVALKSTLESLGVTRAFHPGRADFSGIDGSRSLFLSTVVHEAFVTVDEAGTEAAAATGVAVSNRKALRRTEEPLLVKADRPFLWAIFDPSTNTVLFAGVLRTPTRPTPP